MMAPPVDRAAKMLMIRIMMLSIKDTADTAACPTEETMMESNRPTEMAKNCSTIRGTISRTSPRLLKR